MYQNLPGWNWPVKVKDQVLIYPILFPISSQAANVLHMGLEHLPPDFFTPEIYEKNVA